MATAKKKPRIVFDLVPNRYVFDTGNRMESRWLLKQRGREMVQDGDRQKGVARSSSSTT